MTTCAPTGGGAGTNTDRSDARDAGASGGRAAAVTGARRTTSRIVPTVAGVRTDLMPLPSLRSAPYPTWRLGCQARSARAGSADGAPRAPAAAGALPHDPRAVQLLGGGGAER